MERALEKGNSRRSGRRSECGVGLVEGALVLVLLLLLVFTIIDCGVLFYVYLSLEQGISEASRYGVTGQVRTDPNDPDNSLSRDDSVRLIMREWNSLVNLPDNAFTFEHLVGSTWTAGSGGPGDISRVTVNYNWRLITPLVRPMFPNGQAAMRVSSTMKNEAFPVP